MSDFLRQLMQQNQDKDRDNYVETPQAPKPLEEATGEAALKEAPTRPEQNIFGEGEETATPQIDLGSIIRDFPQASLPVQPGAPVPEASALPVEPPPVVNSPPTQTAPPPVSPNLGSGMGTPPPQQQKQPLPTGNALGLDPDIMAHLNKRDQELREAQAQASRKRRMAGVMEGISEMAHGIGGASGKPISYANMRADAYQPVKDLLTERKTQADRAALYQKLHDQKYGKKDPYKELQAKLAVRDDTRKAEKMDIDKKAARGKEIKGARKLMTANRTAVTQGQTVLRDLKQALGKVKNWSEGNISQFLKSIASGTFPNSEARRVYDAIESAKSNFGINALLNIKREGAGLGQVPQQQLETLMSMLGRFKVDMNPKDLYRNLNDAYALYDKTVKDAKADNNYLSTSYPELKDQYSAAELPSAKSPGQVAPKAASLPIGTIKNGRIKTEKGWKKVQ